MSDFTGLPYAITVGFPSGRVKTYRFPEEGILHSAVAHAQQFGFAIHEATYNPAHELVTMTEEQYNAALAEAAKL